MEMSEVLSSMIISNCRWQYHNSNNNASEEDESKLDLMLAMSVAGILKKCYKGKQSPWGLYAFIG